MGNRSIFALDGISGMLIATVLLLGILGFLVTCAVKVQQGNATNFYQIENEKDIKMFDATSVTHRVMK